MESERLRHFKDIKQIDDTVEKACRAWNMPRPVLDPRKDYWVEVDNGKVSMVQPIMQQYLHGPMEYRVLDDDTADPE
jgi:hypothetical protein